MKRDAISGLLREYARKNLSPTKEERDLVSRVYEAFKSALGENCLLIGSYARFTAIRPLHDLDIIYIAGRFDPLNLNPQAILSDLRSAIQSRFRNPTQYEVRTSQQTHSITISFLENEEEKFGVDIVPALISGAKNEFGEDIYFVPEILNSGRKNRSSSYQSLARTKKTELEWWIKSDPRGYVGAAASINAQNGDFRKAAKFVKRWKHNCAEKFKDFGLKSFHVEQIVYGIFKTNPREDMYGVIFNFFCRLPQAISYPQIKDRSGEQKFIDEYIQDLTEAQRRRIIEARDSFLIKLEYLSEAPAIRDLLAPDLHRRACPEEAYLFDSGIPVFIDGQSVLKVRAKALQTPGGFRERFLDMIGLIERDRKIEFRIAGAPPIADMFKWKVKNDNSSIQPRGEITDHRTKSDPENTKFRGAHYVECYAIKDGACVARAKQNVVLGTDGE